MTDKIETIDSSQMEILSEFRFAGEMQENRVAFRLGILGDDFIIASQGKIAGMPAANVIPENAGERERMLTQKAIERNWWGGDIVFELQNFDGVLERIEEIYGLRPARALDLNRFEIENGKDKIGVRLNSIMPHGVSAPIQSLQIINQRRVVIDDSDLPGRFLYVSPETGELMMNEMRRIQPIIRAKLQAGR